MLMFSQFLVGNSTRVNLRLCQERIQRSTTYLASY